MLMLIVNDFGECENILLVSFVIEIIVIVFCYFFLILFVVIFYELISKSIFLRWMWYLLYLQCIRRTLKKCSVDNMSELFSSFLLHIIFETTFQSYSELTLMWLRWNATKTNLFLHRPTHVHFKSWKTKNNYDYSKPSNSTQTFLFTALSSKIAVQIYCTRVNIRKTSRGPANAWADLFLFRFLSGVVKIIHNLNSCQGGDRPTSPLTKVEFKYYFGI